jgi:hypothetical protein
MIPTLKLFCVAACLSISSVNNSYAEKIESRQLFLIENKGQITDQDGRNRTDIDLKLTSGNIQVFIGQGQIHYQWHKNSTHTGTEIKSGKPVAGFEEIYRMDMLLKGANINAAFIKEERAAYTENYYLPQCPHGITANSYTKVTYQNIYPNIDWVIYSKSSSLKYDFVVHPGGDVSKIKMQYNGATKIANVEGGLIIETPSGNITEQKPYTYDAETKKEITSSFVINQNIVSFSVAGNKQNIVIDPAVGWATYFGGSQDDDGHRVIVDQSGDIILVGETASNNNIATTGSFLTTKPIVMYPPGYIAKFTSSGILLWATYFFSSVRDVKCDNAGNIYCTGEGSGHAGFATPGAHQTTFGGNSDAFLAKFSPSGQRLWSTYYGGIGLDYGYAIEIQNNTVYMAGLMGTGFLAAFDANGTRLWSTSHGITDYSWGTGIACDKQGNIYLSGTTEDTTLATPGAHQFKHGGGGDDACLAKFSGNGTLLWATYYGGNDEDYSSSVTCDDNNNVYITGVTKSTSGIATQGSYLSTYPGLFSSFIVKFSGNGTRQWGTYYGIRMNYTTLPVIQHKRGRLYFASISGDTTTITTPKPIQANASPSYKGRTAIFNIQGSLLWQTYLAGNIHDFIDCIAVDTSSDMYVCGNTLSTTNVATPGAHQTTYGGHSTGSWVNADGGDAWLARIYADTTVYISKLDTAVYCARPGPIKVSYNTTGHFSTGNAFTVQLSDITGSFTNAVNIGSSTSTIAGDIICMLPNNITGGSYNVRVVASAPSDTSEPYQLILQAPAIPAVVISAAPATNVGPYTTITFTANTSNVTSPSYQWRKNGIAIGGATNATYAAVSGVDVHTNDIISLLIKDNDFCLEPDSAISNDMQITVNLSVNNISADKGLELYPNPNKGNFTIEAKEAGIIHLSNIQGQHICSHTLHKGKNNIQLPKGASGVYFGRVESESGKERVVRVVVE